MKRAPKDCPWAEKVGTIYVCSYDGLPCLQKQECPQTTLEIEEEA